MLAPGPLSWPRLTWVAARLHRTALTWCAVIYLAVAALLAWDGSDARGTYSQLGLGRCLRVNSISCSARMREFLNDYVVWAHVIPLLLLAVPLLTGAFAGGAVLARDLERGTFRFAWTQGAGRMRLLSVKLVVLGGFLVLASTGIAALTSWWREPLVVLGSDAGKLEPRIFVLLGPTFPAWTLLAFALGVAVGAVIRRVVVAIAVSVAAWIALAVTTTVWARYYLYQPPLRFNADLEKLGPQADPAPPDSYVISSWLTDKYGRPLSNPSAVFAVPGPGAVRVAPAGKAPAGATPGQLPPPFANGLHVVGLYQPASRFWPFQWTETAWVVVLAALLLAVAFAVCRRPRPAFSLALSLPPVSLPRRGPLSRQLPRVAVRSAAGGTTWPRLAWVGWRQHRTALYGLAVTYAAAAVLLLTNGLAMHHSYRQLGLGNCTAPATTLGCDAAVTQFSQEFGNWTGLVPYLLMVLPVLAGAFAGASVVARDLERGTFRFAWTQTCSRLRQAAARATVLAVALLLFSTATGALAGWWFAPLHAMGTSALYPQYFAIQDPVFPAWALLAFAIAVLAGALSRRVVVAVATAMAGYAALGVPVSLVLRYRCYRPPIIKTASLGQTSITLPPRSFPVGIWWIGTGNKTIPRAEVEHAIASLTSPASLLRWLVSHDARLVVSYQPDSRFWPFQWTETAWLAVLSALLLTIAFALLPLLRRPAVRRAAVAWLPLSALLIAGLGSAGAVYTAGYAYPAASAVPGTPAQGGGITVPSTGPAYLALGDSVAFGYRPGDVTPAAEYLNPANFDGYPEYVAKALGLDVANAACPGETTSSMINMNGPSNGCESNASGEEGGYRILPLHVSYTGSQLSYAVRYLRQHPDAKLVTISIGANDMFRCQYTTADHCTGTDFGRELQTVTGNLEFILWSLRDVAHYHGTIVAVTYYALDYANASSAGQTMKLDAAITTAAVRYGARIAGGYAAFRTASADQGGSSCAAGLLIKLPHGGCDQHPSARGQQVLAAAVQQAMR